MMNCVMLVPLIIFAFLRRLKCLSTSALVRFSVRVTSVQSMTSLSTPSLFGRVYFSTILSKMTFCGKGITRKGEKCTHNQAWDEIVRRSNLFFSPCTCFGAIWINRRVNLRNLNFPFLASATSCVLQAEMVLLLESRGS